MHFAHVWDLIEQIKLVNVSVMLKTADFQIANIISANIFLMNNNPKIAHKNVQFVI